MSVFDVAAGTRKFKDLHAIDGRKLKFEYRPLGDGDVDYLTILRRMRGPRLRRLPLPGHPLSPPPAVPA